MYEELRDALTAANYIAVSTATLARWRLQNIGPKFYKVGRSVRYKISDLDDFVVNSERIGGPVQ